MSSNETPAQKRTTRTRGQLFNVSQFLYVVDGRAFTIQVQEPREGLLTAHAESTSDPHETLHPISGLNLDNVLESMTAAIDKKVCIW
jgi:hypothetical protein